jgi:hypothetical protein
LTGFIIAERTFISGLICKASSKRVKENSMKTSAYEIFPLNYNVQGKNEKTLKSKG